MKLPLAEPPELRRYTGMQRAAALMLALGEEHGGPIWAQLAEDEVKELSAAISSLGRTPGPVAEYLCSQFSAELGGVSNFNGSFETTERLLLAALPPEKVKSIMEDVRGPYGRTMWDKLGNVNEAVLASYLRNEYPQTVAVILHKLKSDHAARVLTELPGELAIEVIARMLKLETVQKDVLNEIEQTLRAEFMTNLARTQKRDPHEAMAEVFNAFSRSTEESLLTALEGRTPESAEKIRALMFTFEDLARLTPQAIQSVLRDADRADLKLALRGAAEELKDLFFSGMSERSGKLLREEIAALGPVRLRDVEDAQSNLVRVAKSLADRGEITLADSGDGDEVLI